MSPARVAFRKRVAASTSTSLAGTSTAPTEARGAAAGGELLTDDDVHALLLEALQRAGGVSLFALAAGVAPSAVSVIKNRRVAMNGRVAKALGIERVRLWTRVRVDGGDLIAEQKNQPRISARTASAAPRRTPRSQPNPDEATAVPAAVSRLSP